MKNTTNIKVPKKYQHGIDEIFKDDDGYWAYSKKGFKFDITESHTAHGYTVEETLSDIRSLTSCDCDECIKTMYRVCIFKINEEELVKKEVDEKELLMIKNHASENKNIQILKVVKL